MRLTRKTETRSAKKSKRICKPCNLNTIIYVTFFSFQKSFLSYIAAMNCHTYIQSRFLPPNYPTTGRGGTVLPRMPEKEVKKAYLEYGPKVKLKLFPHERSKKVYNEEKMGFKVKIVEMLDTGYGRKLQTVLATVKEGREDLQGKEVVLRIFDPVYISPDQLSLIPFHGISFPYAEYLTQVIHMTFSVQQDGDPNHLLATMRADTPSEMESFPQKHRLNSKLQIIKCHQSGRPMIVS